MKIGVVGKGGTGKTTTSALLAQAYTGRGRHVVAVDTDSNPNLGMSLGVDEATAATAPLVPRELVVGGGDGSQQLLADYGVATPSGVTLLHAVRVDEAAGGCMCGGHANVRGLLASTLDDHAGVTVVDMEAGLEHLSRSGGTLAHVDVLLIVMEPTNKAAVTAARTVELARELGILRIALVGNKADPADAQFLEDTAAELGVGLAATIPADPDVVAADRAGDRLPLSTAAGGVIHDVVAFIESAEEERAALLAEKARVDAKLAALGDA